MVKYAKIINDIVVEYPYENLFKDNPNVSFSIPIDEETLNHFNTFTVHEVDKPVTNSSQICIESKPIFDGKIWKATWKIIDQPENDFDEKTKKAWIEIRKYRDQLLKDSDWTMLLDVHVDKDMWAIYRKELRRLPQTQFDPFNIVWPTAPK